MNPFRQSNLSKKYNLISFVAGKSDPLSCNTIKELKGATN